MSIRSETAFTAGATFAWFFFAWRRVLVLLHLEARRVPRLVDPVVVVGVAGGNGAAGRSLEGFSFHAASSRTPTATMPARAISTAFELSLRRCRGRSRRRAMRSSGHVAEPRAVLVDVQLAVESEVVGIRPQEAAHVRSAREDVELLVFHAADVLRADLRLGFDLVVAELPARAGLAEGCTNLKHMGRATRAPGHANRSTPIWLLRASSSMSASRLARAGTVSQRRP